MAFLNEVNIWYISLSSLSFLKTQGESSHVYLKNIACAKKKQATMFRELVDICASNYMGIQPTGFVSLRAPCQESKTCQSPNSFRVFKVSWVISAQHCTAT